MSHAGETDDHDVASHLDRFVTAQQDIYATALAELRRGRKTSHWMWYIFPQLRGLGFSSTSRYYGIQSAAEAVQYVHHPLLGPRLQECAEALLAIEAKSASEIFGYPDDLKLKSSMTLFAHVTNDEHSVFARVLQKYFHGARDDRTLDLLRRPT